MREDQIPNDPDGGWEDRLRSGLHDLERDAPGGGLPGPAQARRTHGRRRTALVVGSALAAVVVTGGTVLALNQPGTTAPTVPATDGPTGTAAPSPTEPAPSTAPSTPPTTGSSDPAVVVPTTIPAGLLLPHEGEEAPADSDNTDWAELEQPLSLWACEDAALTVDLNFQQPTDERWIGQTGPEYAQTIGLQVFESADAAASHLGALTYLAEDCLRVGGGGSPITVVQDLPGSWGQGVLWVESYRADGTGESEELGIGGTYTLVARVGSALAVTQGYGEFVPAVDVPQDSAVTELRAPLDELAPQLCVFTEAGC